ncbi:MAG: hypothetical protein F6K19_44690 [Cyanothece sp. SIO1E1]|nr:hypothetical protein [Cyanothece sp. SIO1E1]
MRKLIIYKTDNLSAPGWEDRMLMPSGGLTDILAQHFDSSDIPTPEPGDRLSESKKLEGHQDSMFPDSPTHYREGDWQVKRVEEYTPELPTSEFDLIVICYCVYAPIEPDWQPLRRMPVSLDSFGGDTEAFEAWQQSQKVGV